MNLSYARFPLAFMPPLPRTSLLKMPTQRRAVETVHVILDAAMRVLEHEGTIGFTTNRVAKVAGVSPGTLYQYFANGEMILAGIVERGMIDAEDIVRGVMLASPELPLAELVRRAISGVAIALEPYSALLTELVSAAPLLARHGITTVLETRIMDIMREQLARNPKQHAVLGSASALYVGVNGIVFVVLKWLCERPPHIPRDALVDTIVGMLEGFSEPTVKSAASRRIRSRRTLVRGMT